VRYYCIEKGTQGASGKRQATGDDQRSTINDQRPQKIDVLIVDARFFAAIIIFLSPHAFVIR
jgi:hypothetical protein